MMDSYGCISSFLASDVPELTITEGLRCTFNPGPSDGNCVEHLWVFGPKLCPKLNATMHFQSCIELLVVICQ
jgi:hypothetical protein